MNRITQGEAIISTGVGQHQMWAAQYSDFREPRLWLTSGSMGTMGFGLPAAIGAQFARPGQVATVKLTAYDFSIYGGLTATLERISADTIVDERGESYYQIIVRTDKSELVHRGKILPIIPGMVASIDILTGRKTVLDYLLKPILKARDRALTER